MLEKALERDHQNRPFEKEIRKFGEAVLADPDLVQKLDAAPDRDAFMDMYCALAKERGISFTKDDMVIAYQEQKQGSNWVLPKKVLVMMATR